jgi:predicted TIM-barrel fold metal-dependent hydrolase
VSAKETDVSVNDAHCHFFSPRFFETLAKDAGGRFASDPAREIPAAVGWEPPGDAVRLADRWAAELDSHGVGRAMLMASVPGDEESVAAAVARHPQRFVGFFMLNPLGDDAVSRAQRAVTGLSLRGLCLFPAMQRYSLLDDRIRRVLDAVVSAPGLVVFVHCGILSVGVRTRLGLPSRFEARFGQPLDVQALAAAYPHVPFVIPHFGAGFFREALMALAMSSNVHVDTSSSNAWMAAQGLTLEDVFARTLATAGSSRILFGTDSSFFPRGWQQPVYDAQHSALRAIGAREEDSKLILGGNFDRLFPLP